MKRYEWAGWTDKETVKRRAGGRRRYNAMRRRKTEARRGAITRTIGPRVLRADIAEPIRPAARMPAKLREAARRVEHVAVHSVVTVSRPMPLCSTAWPNRSPISLAKVHKKLAAIPLSPRNILSGLFYKDLRQFVLGGDFCYCRRMNTVINLFRDLRNALRCIGELIGYLLRFVSMLLQTRASLAARQSCDPRSG